MTANTITFKRIHEPYIAQSKKGRMVKMVNWRVFEASIQSLSALSSFKDRWDGLCRQATRLQDNDYNVWLSLPMEFRKNGDEVSNLLLKFTYSEGCPSPTLDCKAFEANENDSFYRIQGEQENVDRSLFDMAISPSGAIAELMWVRAGHNLSGQTIITGIYETLRAALVIPGVYLYDDSRFTLKGNWEITLNSYEYMPIINPSGLGWYGEKFDFSLAETECLVYAGDKDIVFKQSLPELQAAVNLVRNKQVDDFANQVIPHYVAKINLLNKYNELRKHFKKFNLNGKSTIQQSLTAMFQRVTGKENSDTIKFNSAILFEAAVVLILKPYMLIKDAPQEAKDYTDALRKINFMRLYQKKYSPAHTL